jgi:hypothetical protein
VASISYHVVLPQNLTVKGLGLKQIEVILDITGAEADPLTLQQIRDEPSIHDSFIDRRDNINNLIKQAGAALKKAPNDTEGQKIVDQFNKDLTVQVNTLQSQLQQRCNAFIQKQKKNVNDLFWAQAKMVVRVVWAVAKYLKGAGEISGKVVAAVGAGVTGAGAFLSVIAIKSIITTVNDLMGAADELVAATDDERATFIKLKAAVVELKKIKKPALIPQAKIDAVSLQLGPYGARLLGVDVAAKKTATKLDKLLGDLEAGKFRNEAAQKKMEQQVDAIIKEIIELSKNVAEGRKLLQAAKDKVNEAAKRVQKPGFWDYFPSILKIVDGLLDGGETLLEKKSYKEAFKTLQSKLEDEMKDAQVAEHTTV